MLPKIQARIQHWHHRWAVRWIHTVLLWPRLVLLVPAILVFVAAYAVVYEFLIKHLNARVLRYVHPHQHPHSLTAHQVAATRPRWMYHLRYAAGGDGGVLTPAVLQEVHRWEAALAPAVVVLPLLGWAMAPVLATPVLKYINYDMSPALQRMFFDNITNENHLLTAAAVVDVYVVLARPVAWAEAQANPGAHTGTSTRSTRESESKANEEDTEANDNEGRESQDKHQDKLGSDLLDNQQTKEPNHKEKEKDQNDPSQSDPSLNDHSLHSGTDTSGTGTSGTGTSDTSGASSGTDSSPIAASARIPGLRLLLVAALADPGLLRQFVGFYATEAGTATAAAWVSLALGWAVLCALGAYHVYVYLCLTNQHKLFCTLILMMCWITQTLLVALLLINVVEAAGLTRDEPTLVANMLLYVFVVTLAMLPLFFAGVGLLTDNYAELFPVHKRLYRYYSSGVLVKRVVVQVARLAAALAVVKVLTVLSGVGGVSGGVSGGVGGGLGDISSSSSSSSPSSSPSSPSSLHPSFAAPATLLALGLAKLDRLLVSLVVALVVDFVLGATFMAAAIVVDVKRTVDRVGEPLVAVDSDDEAVPEDAMALANPVLRFLARRNPGWSQWFVTVGLADHDGLRVAALAGLVVAMMVHWLVVVPHRLAREGGVALVGEFDFGSSSGLSGSSGSGYSSSLSSSSLSAPPWVRIAAPTPLRSSHTWLYYIELALIVMFVLAIALIIFRLTFPRLARDDAPHDDDFVEPQRQFNTIDLETKPGTLDIILIKTNCHTLFIVTISLDRTICIWLPLSPGSPPITISPTEGEEPFWPVNHVNILDDGNYVVLFNFRAGVARCFERKQLRFSWESPLPGEIRGPLALGARVLESFFRRRTVPGFLARKVMQKKHRGRVGGLRRGLAASLTSVSLAINGNFPETDEMAKLQKEEMVVVVELGHLVTVLCQEGAIKVQDMLKVFEGERGGNEPRVGGNEANVGGNELKLAGLSPNRAGLGQNEQKLGGLTPESAILSENDPVLDHNDPRLAQNDPSLTQNHSSLAQNDPRLTPTNPGLTPNHPGSGSTTNPGLTSSSQLPRSNHTLDYNPHTPVATSLAQSSLVALAPAKHLKLLLAKKLVTPRINDRIVCQVGTHPELLVATVVNNNWKFRKLPVRLGHYNQAAVPVAPMSPAQGFNKNDFAAMHRLALQLLAPLVPITDLAFLINRPTLVTMEFVGMVVRVKNMSAELVDIALGTVLKTFNVGRFKPQTFRVAHLEPTHCRFCGCALIQLFLIVYEDYDTPTIIMHTFTIDMPRLKTYICLRVERDPREIRCIGFNAVTEHQHWFDNVAGWELTDVNMVIGLRRPGCESDSEATRALGVEVAQTSLVLLKNRPRAREPVEPYQGFIITALDGNLIDYDIPPGAGLASPQALDISYIAKYGYKLVIVNVGRWLEILYLGNDKLIEDDIYYSGNQADVWLILEDQGRKPGEGAPNQTINSELLFINKRARKMRERE